MSALTDYFTSLANKIRSKTGKSATLTPTQMVSEVDTVYQAAKDKAPKFKSAKCFPRSISNVWSIKTWNGLTDYNGNYIWTDGDDVYYSAGSSQYVLNKSTSTWTAKTWNGYTAVWGDNIWTDGDDIYYSDPSGGPSGRQYVLDKSTSTWSTKTWNGFTRITGRYIWTDGSNTYYSIDNTSYVLDKSTSTWSAKTWSGLTSFNEGARHIWTDGDNIYFSNGSTQYVLNTKINVH